MTGAFLLLHALQKWQRHRESGAWGGGSSRRQVLQIPRIRRRTPSGSVGLMGSPHSKHAASGSVGHRKRLSAICEYAFY